jgi:hypothetical protein
MWASLRFAVPWNQHLAQMALYALQVCDDLLHRTIYVRFAKWLRPLGTPRKLFISIPDWRTLATSPSKSPVEWFAIPSARVLSAPSPAARNLMAMRGHK